MSDANWEQSVRKRTHDNLAAIFGNEPTKNASHTSATEVKSPPNPQTGKRKWKDFNFKNYGYIYELEMYRELDVVHARLKNSTHVQTFCFRHLFNGTTSYYAISIITDVHTGRYYIGISDSNRALVKKETSLQNNCTPEEIEQCLLSEEGWLAEQLKHLCPKAFKP